MSQYESHRHSARSTAGTRGIAVLQLRPGTPGIDPGSSFHTLKISVFRGRKLRFLMMSLTLASDEVRSSSDRYKTVRTSAKTRETRASGRGGHAGTSGIDAGSIFEN